MKRQLETMLEMQDRMNRRVHSDWHDRHFAWYRALWLECGELIDHYGYKWWKKQVPDMDQVRLEIVDIWHFGMSMLFDGRSVEQIALELEKELGQGEQPRQGVLEAAEELAGYTLSERRFNASLFSSLMQSADLSFAGLYEAYVGKNVLNFFRQDHGYQEGTYHKNWDGREDNQHLLELIDGLNSHGEQFAAQLYEALETRYAGIRERSPERCSGT